MSPTNLTKARDGIIVRANMAAYSVVPNCISTANQK